MTRTRAPPPSAPGFEHSSKGFVKESEVLHPVDKRQSDDDWPTFSLYNATVYGKQFEGFANLLMVEKKGPFQMRGRMLVDDTDDRQVSALRSARPPRHINVELVAYRMSIGYDLEPDLYGEVPVPAVWAATDYGFFRVLRATPEYQPMLDKMFEAITLYYTVIDIYEKHEEQQKGKKRNRLELDEVLFRYAVDIGEAAVKEEIVDRCHEHAEFLAGHFGKDPEFDWSAKSFTYFIQKLARKPRRSPSISQASGPVPSSSQPVSLPQRSRSTANESVPAASTAPHSRTTRRSSTASTRSQSPAVASVGSMSRGGSSQTRAESSRPTAPAAAAAFSGEARSGATAWKLYNAILDAQSPDPIRKMTMGGITGKLYFKYKFAVYKGAAETLKYYALELVGLMEGDGDLAEEWRASRIYQDLASIDRPMEPQELQLVTPAKIETSLIRRNAQPHQSRRKNPPNAEQPGKTPTAGKSAPVPEARRGRPSGGYGGLRLAATVPRKRFQGGHDGGSGRATKSSKRSHGLDFDDDGFGEGSAETEEEEEEQEEDVGAPTDGESDQMPVRLVMDVEDVPSSRPNGPDGTWVCDQEGCGHVVDGANDADGQVAVREHLHEHDTTSEKVKLAITEGHATGHRPIEYLLEKLKKIGGKEFPKAEDIVGRPQPIKREHGLLF